MPAYGTRERACTPGICTLLPFAMAALGAVHGPKGLDEGAARYSRLAERAWVLPAPLLLAVPSGWVGAFERALALLMIVWLVLVATCCAGRRST